MDAWRDPTAPDSLDKLNSFYWPSDAEKWNDHDEPTS
jgi:hypothetical protein